MIGIAFGNALDGDCYNNFIFFKLFLDGQNPRKLQVLVLQREMTQQGAALKSLEELKARRAALQQQIEAESLEKAR